MTRTLCVAILFVFLAASPDVRAQEEAGFPIVSVKELFLPKDKLPKGWTLLKDRVIRDHHDRALLATVDGVSKGMGIEIRERSFQAFKVGTETFNVDFFRVQDEKQMNTLAGILAGWLQPGGPDEIRWTHQRWGDVLIVVSTSHEKTQQAVESRYLGNLLELLARKADDLTKQGQEAKALKCYQYLANKLGDLPHAYGLWAALMQYEVRDDERAIAFYERAITEGGEKAFDPPALWQLYEGLGLTALSALDLKKAEPAFLKALAIAKKLEDEKLLGETSYNLACTYAELDDKQKMYSHLEQAIKIRAEYAMEATVDPNFAKQTQDPMFKKLTESKLNP